MGQCKNCAYWRHEADGMGACALTEATPAGRAWNTSIAYVEVEAASLESDSTSYLLTHAQFGCMQFEERSA